jgi:hypothetical protein
MTLIGNSRLVQAIKSANGGYTHLLILKNTVIESGSPSSKGIKVDTPERACMLEYIYISSPHTIP